MISDANRIVWEIVEHFRNQIGMFGILVGAVLERCALHIVAVVQQNQFVAQFGFHLFDDEGIVGKFIVTPVSISRFDEG